MSWGQQAAIDTINNVSGEDVQAALAGLGLSLQPGDGQRCLASIAQQCVVWATGNLHDLLPLSFENLEP